MDFPEGMERPDGMPQGGQGDGTETDSDGETTRGPGMGQGGGMMGGDNTLVTRFLENDDFTQLYDDSLAELTESIYDSGDAQDYLDDLVALLSDQASDLIDADTLQSEADAISQTLSGDAATPGAPTGGAPDAEATETPDADES
jgi:spore coat protein CotH